MNKQNNLNEMSNHVEKDRRVHIVPLGYDTERLTQPLILDRADKAYLIQHVETRAYPGYKKYFEQEMKKNLPSCEIIEQEENLWDLNKLVRKYKEIIRNEEKNTISINVSSGSKITAMAGIIVSMLYNKIRPYYAHVHYSQEKKTKIERAEFRITQDLPVFKINQPDDIQIKILKILENDAPIMKKKLADKLIHENIINSEKEGKKISEQAKIGQLNVYLQKLLINWKYIEVEEEGKRRIVKLTEEGRKAIAIFG